MERDVAVSAVYEPVVVFQTLLVTESAFAFVGMLFNPLDNCPFQNVGKLVELFVAAIAKNYIAYVGNVPVTHRATDRLPSISEE